MTDQDVVTNCLNILERIKLTAQQSGRSVTDVNCICISKGQTSSALQKLIDANIFPNGPTFGENYLQEWQLKKEQLNGKFTVHYTGALQSNKIKKLVQLFDQLQTVSSEKLAALISKEAQKIDKIMPIFLQVNISDDDNKQGFEADELLNVYWPQLASLPGVSIQGLMTITKLYNQPEQARPDFIKLKNLAQQIEQKYNLNNRLKLSMGMSSDFEIAIQAGADIVRVGTAIFGER